MKSAKTGNIDLLALLNDRQEAMHEMQDLKFKMSKIEDQVKRQIIKDGNTDLLSVNWTRVRRQNHR